MNKIERVGKESDVIDKYIFVCLKKHLFLANHDKEFSVVLMISGQKWVLHYSRVILKCP